MKKHLFFITLFVLLIHLVPTAKAYEWERLTEKERAFCKPHMANLVETHRTEGSDAALAELEEAYVLAESKFSNTTFFYRIIWWEAQGQSGSQNEEWGIKLYRYLMDRNHRKDPNSAIRIPANDYILYGNISGALRDTGKAAQARAIILQVEESQRKHRNMDTECTIYKDLGPLFSFMPTARKRAFPIYQSDLSNRLKSNNPHIIYYPLLYGIRYAATAAQDTGDWVRAAELNDWYLRYTDEYMKGNRPMRGEVCGVSLEVTKKLAEICLMHGHPEEAARFYEEFIAKAEGPYRAFATQTFDAKTSLALVKAQLGTLTEEALEIANIAEKRITQSPFYSRIGKIDIKLRKARIYYALGYTQEAWEMVNALFTDTAGDVNPYLQTYLLRTAIDLALADGGTHPELGNWLILALENERHMGNKFAELSLYEKYAQYLAINGLHTEAVAIQREAIRLAKAMNLPDRLARAQEVFNQLSKPLETSAPEEHSAPEKPTVKSNPDRAQETSVLPGQQPEIPKENQLGVTGQRTTSTGGVDIQPNQSITTSLPGQPAHGRFYLINPSANEIQGTLQLEGRIDLLTWQNKNWLIVGSSPSFQETSLSSPLTLTAGASCVIDITGLPSTDDGSGAEIECYWMVDGKPTATGRWNYRESTTEKRIAVIDAHEIKSNPFYLVPIHHMIQRQNAGEAEVVDITVQTSPPMRIEAYHDSTGQLLYIDANGDGDFEDKGDLVVSDANRNNWPDLLFDADQHLASIVLYVKPETDQKTEQELTVKLLDNGTWRIDAIDVIK